MLRLLALCAVTAAAAESSFRSTAISTAEQIVSAMRPDGWPMNSTDAAPLDHPYLRSSLYYGAPGISILLRQVHDSSTTPLDEQHNSTWWTQATTRALDVTLDGITADRASYGSNIGLYYGLAGIAFGLRAATGDLRVPNKYLRGAHELEDYILNVRPFTTDPSQPLWNNTDVAHGASGTGLYLLWAAQREGNATRAAALKEGAVQAGKWLLSRAEVAPHGGLRWARGVDTDGNHTNQYFPTFCCGSAGVGYFLADLALSLPQEHSSSSLRAALLDAAEQAAKHILGLSSRSRDGTLLVPHEDEGAGRDVYYLGWCGGPPGWSRLFVKLFQATRQAEWLTLLEDAGLIDHEFTRREAVLCFVWSQPHITDEVRRRERMQHLTFVDFVEALARILTFKAMPTHELLKAHSARSCAHFFLQEEQGLHEGRKLCRRAADWREDRVDATTSQTALRQPMEMIISLLFERLSSLGEHVTRQELKGRLVARAEAKREAAEAKRLAEEEANTPRLFDGMTDILMGSAKRADMS